MSQEEEAVAETVEAAEPVRNVSGEYSNYRDIEWPFDPWGFTVALRAAGVEAVSRVAGDMEKLEIVISTLRCIGQHGTVKIADQRAEHEQTVAGTENRRLADEARALANQKAEVARLTKLLNAAKANLAAKEKAAE